MNLVRAEMQPIKFASSAETDSQEDKDLLNIVYRRIFRAAPEPVLMLYDFIMTTFVPQSNSNALVKADSHEYDVVKQSSANQITGDQIRVVLKLAGIQGLSQSHSCLLINQRST
jgi:hypothetical protein